VNLGGVGELFDLIRLHSVDHQYMIVRLPDNVGGSLEREGGMSADIWDWIEPAIPSRLGQRPSQATFLRPAPRWVSRAVALIPDSLVDPTSKEM
jgi:hypothetical protein